MTPIPILQRAVEERHACFALLREIVPVHRKRGDGSVKALAVVVFSLAGHPSAKIAYAWADPGMQPDHVRLNVALHAGPIDSPKAAVHHMASAAESPAERVS